MTRKKLMIIALSVLSAVIVVAGIVLAVYFLGSAENPYEKVYTYEEAMQIYESGDKVEGVQALRTVKGKKAENKRP